MKRLIVLFSVVLAVLTLVPSAYAINTLAIDQSQSTYSGTWTALNILPASNQSFTAGANNVAGAGIYLTGYQNGPYDGTMTLEIWDGLSGAGGTLLASGTTGTNVNQVVNGWVDVLWTPVSLSVGNSYYLRVTGDTISGYAYGLTDPYPGGSIFTDDGYHSPLAFDFTFRTYYDTAFVPVPSSLVLFSSGLIGIGAAARKRKRN
jgi:hypothetical protein